MSSTLLSLLFLYSCSLWGQEVGEIPLSHKSRYASSKTESGIKEFEPDLMEYLRSNYINCSLCAQNCIRSFTVDERAGPALKNPSVWWRYVLWEDGLWSHVKLRFCISGWEGKEQKGKQMMWTESYADSPDCPWDQRVPFLQTHSAFGSCHWNFWGIASEGSCVHFGGGFDSKRDSERLKEGLCSEGLILPTREAVEAAGATESPEQQLRRGLGVWERVV